jgi:capsular polysaccharide export protein
MNLKMALSRTLLRRAAPFRRQIDGRFPGNAWMGWGRRPLSRKAERMAQWMGWNFLALEDGWIRSLGLGDDPQIYSLIADDRGIYYDATRPSRLETLLAGYDFDADPALLEEAEEAMELIRRHRIAKYNHAPFLGEHEARRIFGTGGGERILIVAQTAGDASLEYGLAKEPTPALIRRAREEHPGARIYLKIHPDALAGLKGSDIDPEAIPRWCTVIREDRNPYSLLERVDRVYTQTSGMGMEALILGKEVHCGGLPWYAGWGVTRDRCASPRRGRKRTARELFAAAYLLYPFYYDPLGAREASLREVIEAIRRRREGM